MHHAAGTRKSQAREGVFISYARSDGEAFAARLRERLEAEGVRLWQDRAAMEGGRDWWLQITEALGRVEFMALVMTPNALRSETVRKEWRHARQQGVCVYPVKGARDLDFASLPGWMRDAHFYDLGPLEGGAAGPEWVKFLNDLRTRCRTPRVPFMVEDLPEDFVMRAGEFERVLSLLLDEGRGGPVAITAALRGAGGYGKTTLARALCHDERVQDAFDDGVLWVTLGETPGDLTGRVEDLIFTLSDERPGFTGIDAAVAHLSELLADRDLLIVIDDVWNEAHLRPFLQGGPRCARLVTTRNADTLPPHAKPVNVDAMRRDEAVELLGAGLPAGEGGALLALAARLGEWPLLLKLVNGTLRERVNAAGQSFPEAVAYVNRALDRRGLTFFDARSPAAREQAVSKTLGVSLDLLDAGERERYGELAVFPEDVDIPLATLERLWGRTGALDEFDTEALCERLARLSLLLRFDLTTRHVRLHDVVRSYLIGRRGAELPELQRQLLDAHRPPGAWADLPADEPYLWDHLFYHLAEAGLGDELVATAKDLRYLAAKTFLRKSAAAEADLRAAERHAPTDAQLRLLRRNFAQSGHILNQPDRLPDLQATLFARLQHLEELSDLTDRLRRQLTPPYLLPLHTLPDLPHPALIRTLGPHESDINSCAFGPDGSFIVSASEDKTLKVWDVESGRELLTLAGHEQGISDCAVSPDGSFIVSASKDGTLKVWNTATGERRRTLTGHEAAVRACAISPDGFTAISASDDRTLKIWDTRTWDVRLNLEGHVDSIVACAFSPDGGRFISVSISTLRMWDTQSGAMVRSFGIRRGGDDCAYSPDGSLIVSASEGNSLKLWDVQSGDLLRTLLGHTFPVQSCVFLPGGLTVASTSMDGTLRLWDAQSGRERLVIPAHTAFVNACAASRDGTLLASASTDGTLKIWDATWGGERPNLTAHLDWVTSCSVSSDDAIVVTASWDKTLKIWQADAGRVLRTLKGFNSHVDDCALSSDGSIIASIDGYTWLSIWENSGALRWKENLQPSSFSCAFSPDGSRVAAAGRSGFLGIWDVTTKRQLLGPVALNTEDGPFNACRFCPDGSLVTVSSAYGTLLLLDSQSGDIRLKLSGHQGQVLGCAFSRDGSYLATASDDWTVKVWDAASGHERLVLLGHKGGVAYCDVSPDGALIASVSVDRTLRVWDAASGECLLTFYADGRLRSCQWFNDGRRLVAAGNGGVYFLRLVR